MCDKKNIKLSLILSIVMCCVAIANKSVIGYLSGFGFAFVALIIMAFVMLSLFLNDKRLVKRLADVYIINALMLLFGMILFCNVDLTIEMTIKKLEFIQGFSKFYAIISLIFLCWILFRFIYEISEYRFKWLEVVLGNAKIEKKAKTVKTKKQPKEVEDGSLEKKPNEVQISNEESETESSTSSILNENQDIQQVETEPKPEDNNTISY